MYLCVYVNVYICKCVYMYICIYTYITCIYNTMGYPYETYDHKGEPRFVEILQVVPDFDGLLAPGRLQRNTCTPSFQMAPNFHPQKLAKFNGLVKSRENCFTGKPHKFSSWENAHGFQLRFSRVFTNPMIKRTIEKP